jgi:hypothetical protein
LIALAQAAVLGFAEPMDMETHDMVIQKLESVLPSVTDKPATKRGIAFRLADLYADRARLKAIEEEDKSCAKCDGAKGDRLKAIGFYDMAFDGASPEEKTHILLQKAHLYELGGDMKKAQAVYEDVIRKGEAKEGRELYGEALAGRGELEYRRGEFAKAKVDFQKALNYPVIKHVFVKYRLAWCYLNEGKAKEAKAMLIGLLKGSEPIDPAFRKDLSRDLATFIARATITNKSIDELIALSPAEARKDNVYYLGTESDRLANKEGSLLVWSRYSQMGEVDRVEALEVKIRVAQTRLDLGQKKEALALMSEASEMWKKGGCAKKDQCDELKDRMRVFVLNWNKREKVAPSEDVLRAYGIYVSLFTNDYEMIYWAAQLARVLNRLPIALKYYQMAADSAIQQMNTNDKEALKSLEKVKEGALLSEIEIAEQTNDLNVKERAYNRYLTLNPNGQKSFEVRYQLAHVYYDRKDYRRAAESFYQLGVDPKGQQDLKVKSADLALDSLAILKDNPTIEKWATEFAQRNPQKRDEYLGIARKASVNEAAAIGSDPHQSTSSLQAALVKLNSAPLAGASKDERIKILKNRILIAEKLRDLNQVELAATELLKISQLSKDDLEFARARKAWVAELRLNFHEALKYAKQLEMKDLAPDKRALRLALLAELAGLTATNYYEDALRATHETDKANLLRAKLVRLSKNPWQKIRQYFAELSRSPNILGPLALEAFARKNDFTEAEHVLHVPGIRSTPAGQSLARYIFIRDFNKFEGLISQHRLTAANDKQLGHSLNERLKLLGQADNWANQALKSSDWSLQILTLNRVAVENQRLFQNLTRLPIPRGLKGADRQKYQALLLQKAEPFEAKVKTVDEKLSQLWSQSEVLKELIQIIARSSQPIRNLIAQEMTRLERIAPSSRKSDIQDVITQTRRHHSREELRTASLDLERHPFDVDQINKVKMLEQADGRPAMGPFLDARLSQLQEGALR